MAEQRERIGAVLLKLGGKGPAESSIEVYDARDWPDQAEADTGLYRLRMGGKWVTDGGRKYTFFTIMGLAFVIAKELLGVLKLGSLDDGRPDLRRGQPCRWRPTDEEACAFYGHSVKMTAGSDPVHCIDGQWRIMMGRCFVCCDEVEGLDRLGRSITP